MVAGKRVAAGNAQLLAEEGVALPVQAEESAREHSGRGCSLIYLAVDGAFAGFIALSDTLRPDAVSYTHLRTGWWCWTRVRTTARRKCCANLARR